MRRVLRFLRVVIPRISVGLLLAQLAFMIGVTGWESLRKKHRKLRRFPYSPAKPVAVGQDAGHQVLENGFFAENQAIELGEDVL